MANSNMCKLPIGNCVFLWKFTLLCLHFIFLHIRITTILKSRLTCISKEVIIMAYVISNDCLSCGTCAGECPVGAISEGDGKFEIAEDACIECGTCAGVCPSEAITLPE